MNYMGYKIVDGIKYLSKSKGYLEECHQLKHNLKEYGFLCMKNPYYDKQLHTNYTKIMQEYFEKRSEAYLHKGYSHEIKPSINFQRGLTPHMYAKQQRNFEEFRNSIKLKEDQPISPIFPEPDRCWRYLQWIKEDNISYPKDLPENLVITDIKNFNSICHEWGSRLVKTARLVAEMLEIAMGLETNTFNKLLDGGEHILSPTGTDLTILEENKVISQLHYDLNFLTIHGPSSYPGLYIWLNGEAPKKLSVIAPEGCFLIQNGRQIEIMTGGYLNAGFHEVINSKEAKDAAMDNKKNGGSGFRVGSIVFSQVKGDLILEPLDMFRNLPYAGKYKPILARDQILEELNNGNLAEKNKNKSKI